MASEKSTAKKTLSVIGNIFIWLFIVFAVVVTVLAFASQNKEGVPTIGGKVILKVQTPSMEPIYKAGDMIVGTKMDTESARTLKVGDIITFMAEEYDATQGRLVDMLKTHKIIEVVTNENGVVEGFYTQGENKETNPEPDFLHDENGHNVYDAEGNPRYALADCQNVICYHGTVENPGTRIPVLGSVIDFLNTQMGFMICVVIPLALFFVLELISFIRKFVALKNDGKKQITAADEEEIKQRAVAEYLKQQAEKEAEAKAAEEKATEAEEAVESEAPAEEAPAEEAPAEEAPAEEAPAEEAPAEEAPAEEAPAEEAPAEEAPAEEEKKPEE